MLSLLSFGLNCDHPYRVVKPHTGKLLKVEDVCLGSQMETFRQL